MKPTENIPTRGAAWQINTLADSARALIQQGKIHEAAQVYENILKIAPYNVRALNFLANRAMENGDLTRSLTYLERAIQAAPNRAVLFENMGLVQNAMGNIDAAVNAFDHALMLRPSSIAYLHKGAILEKTGNLEAAMHAYSDAWRVSPNLEKETENPESPLALRQLVVNAINLIRATRKQIFAKHFDPIYIRYDELALRRVRQATEYYLHDAKPEYVQTLQKPEFLYFPDSEPRAFYSRDEYEWITKLEDATSEIRKELLSILQDPKLITPYVNIQADADPAQWSELNGSKRWGAYHLYLKGRRLDEKCRQCPVTSSIVDNMPLAMLPGHAPDVLFSILEPHTHIPPHFGLGNYKLNVHLPLIVPDDCAIRVGTETRQWHPGRAIIFDDSYEHEAWNNSSQMRAVLIIMIWNPQLYQAEREGMAALLAGINEFGEKYGLSKAV